MEVGELHSASVVKHLSGPCMRVTDNNGVSTLINTECRYIIYTQQTKCKGGMDGMAGTVNAVPRSESLRRRHTTF